MGENGTEAFAIGKGCVHRFENAGEVRFVANDLSGMEWNNFGAITLTAERQPPGTPVTTTALGSDTASAADTVSLWTLLDAIPEAIFTTLLVLIACILLAALPQGRDLIRALGEYRIGEKDGWQQLWFPLATLFLGLQAWFWTRMIITSFLGEDRRTWRPAWLFVWWPRLLGLLPFAAVLLGLFQNTSFGGVPLATVIISAAVFLAFVLGRQRVADWLRGNRKRTPMARRIWAEGGLIAALVAMAWASADPVDFGWAWGPPTVVLLGIALIIPWMVFAYQLRVGRNRLAVTLLLGLALLSGYVMDNHHVGGRRAFTSAPPGSRPQLPPLTLHDAYQQWYAVQPEQGDKVLVLVAAEGGASRAGLWAAQVLGQMEAASTRTSGPGISGSANTTFASHIFAINSVSGGSVGSLGFVASQGGIADGKGIQVLESFAGKEVLSPALTGLLFPDLLQRIIPVAILPDRADALERAWEVAWDDACTTANASCKARLSDPFLSLPTGQQGKRWVPIPIVQGVNEATGGRIFTSRLKLAESGIDGEDFSALNDSVIPVSTAIHNGARFPIVSPAGTLEARGPKGEKQIRYIIDGGYFDNSGLETMRELRGALLKEHVAQHGTTGSKLRIIILAIGNDDHAAQPGKIWLNDPVAPLVGFWTTRAGHAAHLQTLLKGTSAAFGGSNCSPLPNSDLFCKVLLPAPADYQPPMDWALSKTAQDFIAYSTGMIPINQNSELKYRQSRPMRAKNSATIHAVLETIIPPNP